MPVTEKTYERVALEDPEGRWELVCGQLRRKPGMTTRHNDLARILRDMLVAQLDRREFAVSETSRLRISTGNHYIPDVCVIPRALVRRREEEAPNSLEVYSDPLPLVVEVWSRRTGDYDIEQKLREYQLRGDAEVWRIHPRERTLTCWRKQPDGTYAETRYRTGVVRPAALPGVTIDLDELFATR